MAPSAPPLSAVEAERPLQVAASLERMPADG
jgi:hypothetical protein